jgi:hypothetical protein
LVVPPQKLFYGNAVPWEGADNGGAVPSLLGQTPNQVNFVEASGALFNFFFSELLHASFSSSLAFVVY